MINSWKMHKIIYKNHLSSSLFRHCFFSILLKLAINYDGPSVTLQASGHSFRGSTPVPAPWSDRRRRPSVQLCPPGKQRHRRPSRRSLPWQHDILHLRPRPRPRRKFFVAQNLGRNNLVGRCGMLSVGIFIYSCSNGFQEIIVFRKWHIFPQE